MPYELRFADQAKAVLAELAHGRTADPRKLKKVRRALARLEQDPAYPSLHSHQYENFPGHLAEKVWDSYVENHVPAAWRIFWKYGPDEKRDGRSVPVISVLAITPHP